MLGFDEAAARTGDEPEPAGFVADVDEPVMPVPEFPTFHHTPTLPHQLPGNGFESGRDSRAR
ncbi:hypothetical protein FHR83_006539 [Actinoplanes campanulatus]|uniref:Uncharacterized protein n=1 Tax=Actinoplanes campanulatus TaxID=113559 RepID=A0A7W5AMK2_9ACTN|nr:MULTISPECIES: hypothetical protein [Actinoplanes]MBB3098840.1 hypothetical protein [Actinoplanes campanulatus]GGN36771.1 hypothetical protein GCM10010109_62060 [Actinoplanes campanulatus]GID41977.1 hypothetical protein Aca09nite_84830 [Actinoplanes campanulatus]GID46997.1 hypothetical protein Aca07nite_42720 [Actinoplanes capillaceus]